MIVHNFEVKKCMWFDSNCALLKYIIN